MPCRNVSRQFRQGVPESSTLELGGKVRQGCERNTLLSACCFLNYQLVKMLTEVLMVLIDHMAVCLSSWRLARERADKTLAHKQM